MDDDLHASIDAMVEEEHALRARHVGTGLDPQELERLRSLEVRLDQTWDLLRQRQARRNAGQDPATAHERQPGVVEGYLS